MKVSFVDLKRQIRNLQPTLDKTIRDVLLDADFVLGDSLSIFEKRFARFCKKKYCIGLNSGTDAITLALKAYGIGVGDEVITVANTFFSTAMAISNVGATVVFVDCDPSSYNINVSQIEQNITKKTKAIIPVHLYGQPSDMDPIIALSKKYHLHVIEDCCQAHGARYKSHIVPVGETGAFSFYPTKNLGAYGDAGALVTDNRSVYETMVYLRNNGAKKKYTHAMFGSNSRLDSLQAAILTLKLSRISDYTKKRRQIAERYDAKLAKYVQTPKGILYNFHVYHLYVIECKRRNALQKYLQKKGIGTGIHYPLPLHLQKPYRLAGYKPGDFPVTEEKSKHILSLPMFPELTDKEIDYVCKTIAEFYSD